MEDRAYDPSEKGSEEPKDSTESRKPGESLFKYFLRKREAAHETENDQEAEDTPDKATKKRWGLFKGLFSDVIKDLSQDEQPEQVTAERILPLSWKAIQSTEYQPSSLDDTKRALSAPVSELHKTAPETKVTIEPIPEARPALTSTEIEDIGEQTLAAVELQSVEQQPIVTPEGINTDVTGPEQSPSQPPLLPAEKETVIERGVGSALPVLLVGAEYFARKRADRKLDKKIENNTQTLKADINREALNREQLNNLLRKNNEQLERLKQGRGMDSSKRVEVAADRTSVSRVETTHVKPEVTPTRDVKRESLEEHNTQPLPETPIEALETTQRIERVIERSHEVKDDHTSPGAVSVGSIMANQAAQKKQNTTVNTTSANIQTSQGLPVVADAITPDTYRQAMKAGFWAAIIIIILGGIAYLVVK